MKSEKTKRIEGRIDSLFDRLAAEKKKSIVAICLIALMVFMWSRVLSSKRVQSADASMVTLKAAETGSNMGLKISFVDLPNVKGRNDVLARDFFAVDNWMDFLRSAGEGGYGGDKRMSITSKGDGEEAIGKIAEKMKLEVIEVDKTPAAFINGRLLAEGDKFFVECETGTCECKVAKIEQSMVTVKCGESEVRLNLAQEVEINY